MRTLLFNLGFLAMASAAAAGESDPAAASALMPAVLRDQVRADGPALRLGDVFRIEGSAASREIAPAPPPGRSGLYATSFLSAAARSAGYSWEPQTGFNQLSIEGARLDAPQRPASRFVDSPRAESQPAPTATIADPAPSARAILIKRGEQINVVYTQGPLRLTTRARALNGAAEGETVRVLTLPAERQLEARVSGPGEATVSQ